MKKFLIILSLLAITAVASQAASSTFVLDGIHYSVVNDSSVAVTYAVYSEYYEHTGFRVGTYFNNYQGDIVIPPTVIRNGQEYTVKSIGSHAFSIISYHLVEIETACGINYIPDLWGSSETPITSVYIPSSVTSIGEQAFTGCTSLKEVIIPASVTYIGKGAFSGCTSLETVIFEDESKISFVGGWAFQGTPWLENQQTDPLVLNSTMVQWRGTADTIPHDVTWIASGACANLPLKELRIPATVRNIDEYAFENAAFESLTIDENNQSLRLKSNAFKDCESLKRMEINAKYCSVDIKLDAENDAPVWYGAFTGCSLDSVIFGDSLQTISPICYNQYDMTEITIPENVKLIEHDAFALTDLTPHSGKGIKKLNYNAISCDFDYDEMCGIVMEERAIVFSNLRLEQVIIGEEVRKIPENFLRQDWTSHSHPLKKITIPAKVDTIGAYAFNNCVKLESITSLRPEPVEIEASVFEGVDKQLCVLYVPYSSLPLYRSAPVWKSFLNIKSIRGDVNGDDHVNVSDVAALINQILGIESMNTDLADVNGDGRVNVSDVAALINIILGIQ